MSGRRKGGSELVSGHDGNVLVSASVPDEMQPQRYSVGKSTFYVSTATETQQTRQGGEKFKLDNSAYPVQEASLEASVTSENVMTIMQQARKQVYISIAIYRENIIELAQCMVRTCMYI